MWHGTEFLSGYTAALLSHNIAYIASILSLVSLNQPLSYNTEQGKREQVSVMQECIVT